MSALSIAIALAVALVAAVGLIVFLCIRLNSERAVHKAACAKNQADLAAADEKAATDLAAAQRERLIQEALFEVDRSTLITQTRARIEREQVMHIACLIIEKEKAAMLLAAKRQYGQAIRGLNEVLGLATASGCPAARASALHNLAVVYARMGDIAQAIDLTREAIELATGHVHTSKCSDYYTSRRHDVDKRVATYREHLGVFERSLLNRKAMEIQTDGLAALAAGDSDYAVECLRQAANVACEAQNPFLQVGSLINCATAYGAGNKAELGLAVLKEALAICQDKCGSDREVLGKLIEVNRTNLEALMKCAPVNDCLARVRELGAQGDHEGAEEAGLEGVRQAIRIFGPRDVMVAVALDVVGVAQCYQGENARAFETFERALDIASEFESQVASVYGRVKAHYDAVASVVGYGGDNTDWKPDEEE